MPKYNYCCFDCEKLAVKAHADNLVDDDAGEPHLPLELFEELVLFETSHMMNPTKKELQEATECPRCGGHNCEKSFHGTNIKSYIRGYGWLDKNGAKRDMNRCKLAEDDPYGKYRVAGEVDYIDAQLKQGGRHNPRTKHFVQNGAKDKDMEDTVDKVVSTPKKTSDD